jgi:hypothetical protein
MAVALGATSPTDAAPSRAAALDDALRTASAPGPDTLALGATALRSALGDGPIQLDPSGRLTLRDLAAPQDETEASALSLLAGAIVARGAAHRDPAQAPAALARPADAFFLPDVAWRDCAAALADLSADGAALSPDWFRRGFERRFPVCATEEAGALRLAVRRAAEPSPEHVRLAILVEGAEPPLLIDGRSAPATRSPGGAVSLGLRWRRDAPPLVARIDLRGSGGRRARLSAQLEIRGDAVRLSRLPPVDWPDVAAPWPVSPFAPSTLALPPPA